MEPGGELGECTGILLVLSHSLLGSKSFSTPGTGKRLHTIGFLRKMSLVLLFEIATEDTVGTLKFLPTKLCRFP